MSDQPQNVDDPGADRTGSEPGDVGAGMVADQEGLDGGSTPDVGTGGYANVNTDADGAVGAGVDTGAGRTKTPDDVEGGPKGAGV